MQPLDAELERRVWSRVLGVQQEQTQKTGSGEEAQTQAILEHLRAARTQYASYRSLAAGAGGGTHRTLCALAAQTRGQARTLAAMYELLSGARPEPEQTTRRKKEGAREALRVCCLRELSSARAFGTLAAEDGPFAEIWEAMAAQARSHVRALLGIMKQYI